jgi:hypothetical protein
VIFLVQRYVQYHRHSETDVEEVFVDQLGPRRRQKIEKLYRESILRIIWPLPGLLTILQKTFEEANKEQDTGLVIYWVHCKPVADIFIGMKYSTEMNPTPLAVFDEQHISSFKEFFIPRASGRDIFQGLVRKGMVRGGDGNIILMDELEIK